MKNNKGFTLVELLATVVIILLLGLIVTPNVVDIINENRNKGYHEIERRLEEAASKYIVNEYIDSSVESVIITKEDLINAGYIEEVYDLKDNSVCDASIYVNNINSVAEFNSILSCSSYKTKTRNAVWYIKDLYEDGDARIENGLINPKVTHEGIEYDTGIRYAGANPNNYVYFNCEEVDSNNNLYGSENYNYESSCEMWRIIGVFEVDNGFGRKEKRVKLIRNDKIGDYSWDSSTSSGNNAANSGWGINQWGESKYSNGATYEGADLNNLLNTIYYKKSSSTKCYIGLNDLYESCDFSDIGLGKNAKSMITSVIWNIGGVKWDQIRRAENSYINERGQQGGKICDIESEYNGGKSCTDTVNRTTEWYGKIGLIYPSDYMYASTNSNCRTSSIDSTNLYCKNDNWLYAGYSYWFLTPSPTDGYSTAPWYAYSKGNINNDAAARNFGIRPSLYLNSSIKIIGGNGSSSLPYILGM